MCGRGIMGRFGVWDLVLTGRSVPVGVRMGLLSYGNSVRGVMGCGKTKEGYTNACVRIRPRDGTMEHAPLFFLYSCLVFYRAYQDGVCLAGDDAVCLFTGCISLLGWLSVFY